MQEPVSVDRAGVEFHRDIRPLFCSEQAHVNAETIHQRLADKSMPCDATLARRPGRAVACLIDAGSPP